MCECAWKNLFYVSFSMLKSCLLMFCWRKKTKQLLWCCDLPTLHWVSSTPHSANRRWTKVRRGDGDNSCVHVYSRTFKNVLFFFILCKIYLPYSGFYCGIIQSGIIIQYCTILFRLLMKKEKVLKKKILKTKVRKKNWKPKKKYFKKKSCGHR